MDIEMAVQMGMLPNDTDAPIIDAPKKVQVGGSHYVGLAIQPVEYAHKNGLNFCQGSIVKYVTRYKDKNGKQDLEKAKHFIDLLIAMEYGDG